VQNAKGILADDVLPDGTVLKKGGLVTYASYAQGRMTDIWGADASQFKPERFMKDGKFVPENPFKFSAFQVCKPCRVPRSSSNGNNANLRPCQNTTRNHVQIVKSY